MRENLLSGSGVKYFCPQIDFSHWFAPFRNRGQQDLLDLFPVLENIGTGYVFLDGAVLDFINNCVLTRQKPLATARRDMLEDSL